MLRPLIALLLVSRALAVPAVTTLTLVSEPGFNKLDITVSGPAISTSQTQSTLTGTVSAWLDVKHQDQTTSELTLGNGVIAGSDFSAAGTTFYMGFPVGTYQLSATGLAGDFYTTHPPGTVNAAAGTFSASQHRFVINQGNVTGSALGQTFNTAFDANNPFAGIGSGTGTVTLTPSGSNADSIFYQVVVVVPGVNVSDSMAVGNPPYTTMVTVTGTGTIKAVGVIEVPRSAFKQWTDEEGISGALFSADANGDGVSNGIAWAMGLGALDPAGPWLPRAAAGFPQELDIPFPPAGSRAPVWIEVSTALGSWTPLPAERCSRGVNPLPKHINGTVRVSGSGAGREFFRLRAEEE
jgi:hypothetical protein